jgi:hypothetical protein
LREQLARVLGIQTVDLLIERARTEISEAHPVLRRFSVRDLEQGFDPERQEVNWTEFSAALGALTAVMVLILARLLGKQVADSIARDLDRRGQFSGLRL